MPCKTFIPRGILTFVFLNLEIENLNEKADQCFRIASSQSQSIHYRAGREGGTERDKLCLGPRGGAEKKKVDLYFVPGHPQLSDTSLHTGPGWARHKPWNSWRGSRLEEEEGGIETRGKDKGTPPASTNPGF